MGIPTLILAAAGLMRPIDRAARSIAVVGGFGFLLALGKLGPLHPLFFHLLGPYQRFRVPGRAIFLVSLALALLAARGIARWESGAFATGAPRRRLAWITIAVAALVVGATAIGIALGPAAATPARVRDALVALALAGATHFILTRGAGGVSARPGGAPSRAGWLLAAIVASDLALSGFTYNLGPNHPASVVFSKTNVVDYIRKSLGGEPYRVTIRCPEGMLLMRNAGSLLRVATLDGYNQLRLRRSHELMSLADAKPDGTRPGAELSRIHTLWSVLYRTQVSAERGSLALVKSPAALPRARLVHEARVFETDDAILGAITSADWLPAFDRRAREPAGRRERVERRLVACAPRRTAGARHTLLPGPRRRGDRRARPGLRRAHRPVLSRMGGARRRPAHRDRPRRLRAARCARRSRRAARRVPLPAALGDRRRRVDGCGVRRGRVHRATAALGRARAPRAGSRAMKGVRDEAGAPAAPATSDSGAGEARTAARSGGLRGALPLLIRLAVSAALLVFLFSKVPLADVLALFGRARGDIVLLSAVLFALSLVGSAYQWWLFLRAQRIAIPFRRAMNFYLVGLFLNNFLPANVGGDVMKVIDVGRSGGTKVGALTATLLDRAMGLFVLVLAGTLAAVMLGDALPFPRDEGAARSLLRGSRDPFRRGVIAARRARGRAGPAPRPGRAAPAPRRAPDRARPHAPRRPPHLPGRVRGLRRDAVLRIAVHYLAAIALGVHVAPILFALLVPVIAVAITLPISIGGFGVREGLGVVLFGRVGVGSTEALAFELLSHLVAVLVSLWGGVLFILRGRDAHRGAAPESAHTPPPR